MDEKLTINIMIAERRYPMKIERGEEERIRKAAKILNDRILQYRQAYTGKDSQDFMAMAGLEFVIKMLDLLDNQDISPVIVQIEQVNNELEAYLNKV